MAAVSASRLFREGSPLAREGGSRALHDALSRPLPLMDACEVSCRAGAIKCSGRLRVLAPSRSRFCQHSCPAIWFPRWPARASHSADKELRRWIAEASVPVKRVLKPTAIPSRLVWPSALRHGRGMPAARGFQPFLYPSMLRYSRIFLDFPAQRMHFFARPLFVWQTPGTLVN